MAEGIKSLRVERYKLDTATQGLLVHSAACYLLVRRTSSAGVEIGVQINDRDHPMVPLTDGEGWQHLAYNRLYLTWTAQPGQWIELAFQGTPSEEDLSKFQLFKRSDKSNVQVTNDSLAPVPVSATNDFLAACLAQLTKLNARLAGLPNAAIDETASDSQDLRIALRSLADRGPEDMKVGPTLARLGVQGGEEGGTGAS